MQIDYVSVQYWNILFHKTEESWFHQVESRAQSSTCMSTDILQYNPNPKVADTGAV